MCGCNNYGKNLGYNSYNGLQNYNSKQYGFSNNFQDFGAKDHNLCCDNDRYDKCNHKQSNDCWQNRCYDFVCRDHCDRHGRKICFIPVVCVDCNKR